MNALLYGLVDEAIRRSYKRQRADEMRAVAARRQRAESATLSIAGAALVRGTVVERERDSSTPFELAHERLPR